MTPEQAYQQDPVAFCIQELQSPRADIRYNAVDILRACGPDSARSIQPLLDLFQQEQDLEIRRHIAFTLQDIACYLQAEMAAVEEALLTASHDPDSQVRSALASLFGQAQLTSPPVLSRLQQLSNDPDPEVVEYAQRSLSSFTFPNTAEVLPEPPETPDLR